jgi:hypothetical protein
VLPTARLTELNELTNDISDYRVKGCCGHTQLLVRCVDDNYDDAKDQSNELNEAMNR